jgi:acyl carrier protein
MSVIEIVRDVFGIRRSDLTPEAVIMDQPEWDSMTHMTLIMRLEDELAIQFNGDEIAAMRTIADIEKAVNSKTVKA